MIPAVIYARVSSRDQEREGFSIPAQLKLLREYAGAHGFRVVHEFVDVETAKVTGRKQFTEMVRFLGGQERLPYRASRKDRSAISQLQRLCNS